MQSYYEKYGALAEARNSYDVAVKAGNLDEAQRIARDFPRAASGEFANFEEVNRQMRSIRDAIRGVVESEVITDNQKRGMIRGYEKALHALATQGLTFF
jgi:hypothetical protein